MKEAIHEILTDVSDSFSQMIDMALANEIQVNICLWTVDECFHLSVGHLLLNCEETQTVKQPLNPLFTQAQACAPPDRHKHKQTQSYTPSVALSRDCDV